MVSIWIFHNIYKNIIYLQITMHHPIFMQVIHTIYDL